MGHQVREMTLRFIVDDDGPAPDSFAEAIQESIFTDDIIDVEIINEETRDATFDEAASMGWQTPCPTCYKDASTFVDGDCRDCNPPIEGSD